MLVRQYGTIFLLLTLGVTQMTTLVLLRRAWRVGESPEVSLGDFRYWHRTGAEADFHLHVALLTERKRSGRVLLEAHRQRVRDSVEQVLRGSDPSDFSEPTLAGFKRRVQRSINETLNVRVVDEVLVTKFQFAAGPAPESALPPDDGDEHHVSVGTELDAAAPASSG